VKPGQVGEFVHAFLLLKPLSNRNVMKRSKL